MEPVEIPASARRAARLGLALKAAGFAGAQATGIARAHQLASQSHVPLHTVRTMRAWFARHAVTSHPGYARWVAEGRPCDGPSSRYRGAVAWLVWGGTPAYRWVFSDRVTRRLRRAFPDATLHPARAL